MPFVRNYLHLIWTTKYREPLISTDIEPFIYGYLYQACDSLRTNVLALNGVADHVHLIVNAHPTVSIATLVKQLKGGSSRSVARDYELPFAWQTEYSAFTISENLLPKAIRYVEDQKIRHANGRLIPRFEPEFSKR